MLVSVFSVSPESSVWESDWESEDEAVDDEEEKKKRRRKTKKRKAGEPIFGENCHLCRRETVMVDHVKCSRCPLRFCGPCLLRRHGEDVEEETEPNVRWVCPICRGGCGPGCLINCCNCGPCRKYQELEPAGRIVPAALKAGFTNVHDYLIHFETGESAEVIAGRKEQRGWTKATGAIDMSVDVTKEDSKPHWAMKRIRGARRRLVFRSNSKWANQDSKRCGDEERNSLATAMIQETEDLGAKRVRRPSVRLTSY